MFESLGVYAGKKLIDLGIKKSTESKKVEEKKESLEGETKRNIAGIWICQYRYPKMNDNLGTEVMTTETQVVRFVQNGNKVNGSTIHANAHPEDFEGVVTKDRYFTGLYFNQANHHSYHGAFQFVLSNSKNRMKGKWIGFNREGNEIESNDWRWEQVDDNPDISKEKQHKYVSDARDINLFSFEVFI